MKTIELKPIRETKDDYDALEARIRELFRREIFLPLVRELKINPNILQNSRDDLLSAIQSGQISFSRGSFKGQFNSAISRELRKIGAKWDRTQGSWKVPASSLPIDVRAAISASESVFAQKLAKIDERLRKLLPEEIADRLKVSNIFDRALFKVEREFQASVAGITVAPKLSDEQRKRIADEYSNNMKLYIKDFSEKQITELRADVQKSVFTGNRYESLVDTIQKRYEVSANKAKFLARQETSLLMTKFKETRYADAGVKEYIWGCVVGSPKHPVRPAHKKLEGKIFRWDDPPITTEPGEPVRRNNPGQDFNCRCFARPIVRFK